MGYNFKHDNTCHIFSWNIAAFVNADTHFSTIIYISSNIMLNIMAIPQNTARCSYTAMNIVCHQQQKTCWNLTCWTIKTIKASHLPHIIYWEDFSRNIQSNFDTHCLTYHQTRFFRELKGINHLSQTENHQRCHAVCKVTYSVANAITSTRCDNQQVHVDRV